MAVERPSNRSRKTSDLYENRALSSCLLIAGRTVMTARPDGLGAAGCCGCWHEDDGRILLERCYRIACPPHALPINGRRAYQSHLSTSPLYFTIPASILSTSSTRCSVSYSYRSLGRANLVKKGRKNIPLRNSTTGVAKRSATWLYGTFAARTYFLLAPNE